MRRVPGRRTDREGTPPMTTMHPHTAPPSTAPPALGAATLSQSRSRTGPAAAPPAPPDGPRQPAAYPGPSGHVADDSADVNHVVACRDHDPAPLLRHDRRGRVPRRGRDRLADRIEHP